MAIYARAPVETALTYYVRHEESLRRGLMETLQRLGYTPQCIITGKERPAGRSVAILFGTPRNGGYEYVIPAKLLGTEDAWAMDAEWRICFDMTMDHKQLNDALCTIDASLCRESRDRARLRHAW